MTKYRILAFPDMKPGKCANCGSAKQYDRQYVDLNVQIEWYGTIFLCSLCIKDIANNINLFAPLLDEIRLLKVQLLKIDNLQQQGITLHDTVLKTFEEIKEYYASLGANRDNNSTTADNPVSSPEKPATESGVNPTKQPIMAKEQRTNKSTSGSGSKNVPSLAELLEQGTKSTGSST